ncbi:MAG TPA: hypothetical protein PK867_05715, partial [Pirellulales bacterium]|nr:hypothetical protein [Pirellulales bacterium]
AGPTVTTVAGPSVVFGSGQPLTDTATLAGGSAPTGTITFYLFAPNVTPAADDSNNIYSDTVTVTGDGSYSTASGSNPGGHVPGATGTYQWIAVYSGDANNSGAATNLGDEPEKSTPAGPTVTTVAGPSVVFGSGRPLTDTATLSGGSSPTGAVTFYLFAPGVTPAADDGNNVYSDTVTVTGDGNYSTASGSNPGGHVPGHTGTYQWIAVYSGDANNNSVSSKFGDEPQKVVPPTPVTPSIVTNQGGTVVLGSGNKLTDTATLSGGNSPTGTVTFYLFAPGVAPAADDSNNVYTDTVTVSGNGTYSTASGTNPGGYLPTAIGTYQWIAVYGGDANNNSVASNYGDEAEVVASPPAISTFEGGTLHLGSGGKLYDSAQLQGGMNPTGTITFYLFAPGVTPNATDSNNIYTDTVAIDPANPHGLYDVTMGNNSGGPVPTQTGTYQWVAVYSGDANNPPQASQFGDEPQKVVPPAPVTPTIVTNAGGTVVLGSGNKLSDTATLSNGNSPTGTITFDLFAPGVTPNATDSNNVYSDTVTISGNGTYSTDSGTNPGGYLPTVTGTYQWIAVYGGDANNNSVSSNFGDEPQVVTSQGQAQVVVFKLADQQSIDAGQTAGFTIKMLNEGVNTATGVTLNDALPPGVAADVNWQIDSSGSGFGAGTDPSDFTITGPVGHQVLSLAPGVTTLAAGASISVHLTGQTSLNDVDPNLPPCSTTLVNTATVNAANEPANDQNAQASATITLHNVDLDVSKTADQTQIIAGQIAGFTIQIYNQGCVEPQNLTLSDQLSAGPGNDIYWRLDPTTDSPEFFTLTGQIGHQQLQLIPGANLQPGGLISVHIIGQTTINDVGTLNNTATVNASNEP